MKRNMYTPSITRMVKFLSLVLTFIMAISIATVPAYAATYTDEYVLETETIVLVDRSGSMKDRNAVENVLAGIDTSNATLAYFDSHKLTLDANYNVGGNSAICEAIDAVARGGFTHIAVVTDAEQWPEDYSSLGIYTDLDIKIFLTEEKDAQAEKLIAELLDSLVKSNLTIVNVDGTEEVLMNDYVPEKHVVSIEIPDPVVPDEEEPDHGDPVDGTATPPVTVIEQTVVAECNHKCPWWLFLILAVLIAALFDFIHELITRRRGWYGPVIDRLNKGDKMIIDVSGSFSGELERAIASVEKAIGGDADVIAFAGEAVECKLSEIRTVAVNRGKTDIVPAAELASKLGCKGTIWFTDAQFNGRPVTEARIAEKFERTTAVLTSGYDRSGVSELRKISKKFRVRSL